MTDSRIDHDKCQEILLSKCNDLEDQCQALQEYNSELEESRSRYATIFNHSAVGSVILDSQGVIVDGNLMAGKMLGIQQYNMIGMPFSIIVAEEDVNLFWGHLRRCKSTNASVCTEFKLKSHSSSPYCIQIISVPFILLEHQIYFNSTIIDVRNQKRFEQELQRLDRLNLVGEMAASIAHEIRNPMTTVRGYLQLFKKRSSREKEIEALQIMIEELDRANAIITEFLALAKNKNNDLLLRDINHIITTIYPLVQAEAALDGKEIILDLCPQLPMIMIDGKEIRQVLFNLVSNGLQAMKKGQVLIRTFMDQGKVIVAVEDQGHGIPDEIKDQIGKPFFTTKECGTGLGMAICYSIAQRHNAKLDFITGPKGTTFFICFP